MITHNSTTGEGRAGSTGCVNEVPTCSLSFSIRTVVCFVGVERRGDEERRQTQERPNRTPSRPRSFAHPHKLFQSLYKSLQADPTRKELVVVDSEEAHAQRCSASATPIFPDSLDKNFEPLCSLTLTSSISYCYSLLHPASSYSDG